MGTLSVLSMLFLSAPSAMGLARTCVVFPLENRTELHSLSWVGEACAVSVSKQLKIPGVDAVGRNARVRLVEDADLPPGSALSRASMIRIARKAKADYLVSGWYEGSTQTLRWNVQTLNLNTMKILAPIVADGPLEALPQIENHLAFEVLSQTGLNQIYSRTKYQERMRTIPNRAFSNYIYAQRVKGRAGKIKLLRKALEAADDFIEARLMLSRLYYRDGSCDTVMKLWSDHEGPLLLPQEAQFMRGTCFLGKAQLEDAVAAYRAVLQRSQPVAVLNNLGVARVRQGDIALGIQHLLAAYETSAVPIVAKNLAVVRHLEANHEAALALLTTHMVEDEGTGEMYYLRSVVQRANGNLQEAERDSAKAVELGFELAGQEPESYLTVVLNWEEDGPSRGQD